LQTREFCGWLNSLEAVDTITDYRANAEQMRDEVLARALRMLDNGKSPQEALGFLAHTLTNKLLHAPSVNLRQASSQGKSELLKAAHQLLQNRSGTKV
jgi:glutamyl-tRNA reductase